MCHKSWTGADRRTMARTRRRSWSFVTGLEGMVPDAFHLSQLLQAFVKIRYEMRRIKYSIAVSRVKTGNWKYGWHGTSLLVMNS